MGNIYKKREQKAEILKQVDILFARAAAKEVKSIGRHFKQRKSWPLDFTFIRENVFYDVMDKHLETYLLPMIAKHGLWAYYDRDKMCIMISKKRPEDNRLIISRPKGKRRK